MAEGNGTAETRTDPLRKFGRISTSRQSSQRRLNVLGKSITFLLRASAKVKVTVNNKRGQLGVSRTGERERLTNSELILLAESS